MDRPRLLVNVMMTVSSQPEAPIVTFRRVERRAIPRLARLAQALDQPVTERHSDREPIVITGIGLNASLGHDRESVWRAVRNGASGIRSLVGVAGIPEGLRIGAPAPLYNAEPGRLKVIDLARRAASEALLDANIEFEHLDRDRFGCAISGHMGDTAWVPNRLSWFDPDAPTDGVPWWHQWMPNTACAQIAHEHGLLGPRLCHSTACASGLIDVLAAARAIQDDQCDIALAGSAEGFHPLFAAGFHAMRVLAQHDDPQQASRPFDRGRNGFVMGEGSAMFVLERLSHAVARKAPIYAELAGGKLLSQAHHVTGLDAESTSLAHLISTTLRAAHMEPAEIEYINAHGTGTLQNDVVETRAIRHALGTAADRTWVSATKSMLGHLVNAAGSVEMAITVLALRDGFAPATLNLTDPDPDCDLDCIPMVGREKRMKSALKLSVAFGGHMAAVALRRWENDRSACEARSAA